MHGDSKQVETCLMMKTAVEWGERASLNDTKVIGKFPGEPVQEKQIDPYAPLELSRAISFSEFALSFCIAFFPSPDVD